MPPEKSSLPCLKAWDPAGSGTQPHSCRSQQRSRKYSTELPREAARGAGSSPGGGRKIHHGLSPLPAA